MFGVSADFNNHYGNVDIHNCTNIDIHWVFRIASLGHTSDKANCNGKCCHGCTLQAHQNTPNGYQLSVSERL